MISGYRETNSSPSLPPEGLGGVGEFLMLVLPLHCRHFRARSGGLVEHLRPPDGKEQKRGLPRAQDCVGQSCKPNMP